MRRKSKFFLPARYLLLIMSGVCIIIMLLSFTLNISGGPLNAAAGYVFVPMQEGINKVGTWISDKAANLKNLSDVMAENENLQNQVDELTTELNTIKLEQYELDNLRELYNLDQKYPSYEKVAANVIGKNSGNWFNTFTIDKGSNDGIEVDMNVMAGSGPEREKRRNAFQEQRALSWNECGGQPYILPQNGKDAGCRDREKSG